MKTFTDNAGRVWTIAINVNAIKRVRGLIDVNLLEVIEGTLLERLIRDPILLCDVVYAVCKPEADALNVTDEQFGQAMAGDAIDQATKALLEELVGFSPSPQGRANLQRILETTWRMIEKAQEVIAARIDSGEIERAAEQLLATSSDSSGSSPASAESSPAS
jgi:hypothetical protein